jgi:hypothetical protein
MSIWFKLLFAAVLSVIIIRVKSRIALTAIAILLLIFVGLPLFLFFFGTSQKSGEIVQLANLKTVAEALYADAQYHDGKFPKSISDLPPGRILPVQAKFCNPVTKQVSDWLYYPGRSLNDPSTTLLAASLPITTGTRTDRVITFVDTVTEIVLEPKFQQILSSQPK